jgi:hypothetical protein
MYTEPTPDTNDTIGYHHQKEPARSQQLETVQPEAICHIFPKMNFAATTTSRNR